MPESLGAEKVHAEEKKEQGMPRRKMLQLLGGGLAFCLGVKKTEAQMEPPRPSRYEKGWSYTSAEMQTIYDREYNGEKILKNAVVREGDNLIGAIDGKKIIVPQKFIDRMLRHMEEMLDLNAAKFISRLDAFHGHLFVPETVSEERYKDTSQDLPKEAVLLFEDNSIGILYHNSEHFKPSPDRQEETERYSKRNVLGYYDGRPLKILPLPTETKRTAAHTPEGTRDLSVYPKFAAHKDGVFSITVAGQTIRIDISFDDSSYY